MGMFDWVNYECVCPQCHSKVDGFQSKDGDCVLDKIEPHDLDHFYATCGKCGCWIEINRKVNRTDNFEMVVEGKWDGMRRAELHRKRVKLPPPPTEREGS